MIVMDTPRQVSFRGRTRLSCHLGSTYCGAAGTGELYVFALQLGLKRSWIQNLGKPTEHFDLFDGAIERARQQGAVEVTPRAFIERVVLPKRQYARERS